MKLYLFVLVSLFAAGCGEVDDPPMLGDGGAPGDDDAGIPPESDINPPLTPDDPCRQLKAEVPEGVYWAGAGWQGDMLVVLYQSPMRTGMLAYRGDLLIASEPILLGYASQPLLYHERGLLRFAIAITGTPGTNIYEIRDDGDAVLLRNVPDVVAYRVASGETPDGDMLSTLYGSSRWLSTVNVVRPVEMSSSATSAPIASWWPMRIGSPTVVRLLFADFPSAGNLSLFAVDYGVASGSMRLNSAAITPAPNTYLAGGAALSEESMGVYSVVYENGMTTAVQYRELDFTAGQTDIRTVPGSLISDAVGHDSAAYTLVSRLSEDGETSSWHLLRGTTDVVAARAEKGGVGMAIPNRTTLLLQDNVVTWAGPTIPDDGPRIAPTSAIAVCSYTL